MVITEDTIPSIITLILTFITLFIPLPIPVSDNIRIIAIAVILTLFIAISLTKINQRLEEIEEEQQKVNEKLLIYNRLSKIEARLNMRK